ncbi:MAG: hypothetical protein OXE94_01910 [Aestuariivita sp.]|nr:hypothetical protein [Aestuariivita sp.]MCY4202962.1 hypothetical protein [Aestuariivita sp.]
MSSWILAVASQGSAAVEAFLIATKRVFCVQILAQSRWLSASVSGFGNGIGFGIANSPPAGGEHP